MLKFYILIIATLRAETKIHHAELDHALYPMIIQTTSIPRYTKLLSVFYGYFKPMQQQFDQFLNDDTIPGYSLRRKPSWIRNDIQQCNEVMNAPLCHHIPVMQNRYEALGAFYVLEGSVMGGAIISKKLKDQLNIDDNCVKFFSGYGENNSSMWKDFLSVLDGIEEGSKEGALLINKAKDSFSTFKKWIDEQYG